eukprot:1159229-Pelagomonas_calceolata.AAC.2
MDRISKKLNNLLCTCSHSYASKSQPAPCGPIKKCRQDNSDAKIVIPEQPLDLSSQDSIHSFADEINRKHVELHILINNAGVSFMEESYSKEGIGALAQTFTTGNPGRINKRACLIRSHGGPYISCFLLAHSLAINMICLQLVASHARVVTVSSISHRMATLKDEKV